MSCFKLPSDICEEIEQLLCNFWWGDKEGSRKVHWMSWKHLCRAKSKGRMDFRNLEMFNLALLAKQAGLGNSS